MEGWEIRTIEATSSGYSISGVNHETSDPLMREFSWHVPSLTQDPRYFIGEGVEKTITAKTREALDRRGWPRVAERLYHIVAINERSGAKVYCTAYPMNHADACVMLGKFNHTRKGRRVQLEETQHPGTVTHTGELVGKR